MTVLVQDNFDGAAGIDLQDHTPDIDVEGGGWVTEQGAAADFELDGSGEVDVAAPGGTTQALIDCGKSDIKITGTLTTFGETNNLLFLRAVDDMNYLVVFLERFAIGGPIIRKVVAGTPTNLAFISPPPGPNGAGTVDFEITAVGPLITYKDLGIGQELSVSDPTFQTATRCGFGDLGSDGAWKIDYTIEEESAAVALPTTPGRAFNKVKRDPGTARAVYEAPIAPVLSMENEALGAGAFAPVRPTAQIYGLLVQAIGDAIRFSVAGDSPASATVGFRLIVDDPPILIPIGPGVFPSFFGEGAGAILAYQWTA